MVFDFFIKVFSEKWIGVGSMNGEFEDLSIDNKFELNAARSGLEWFGASFNNTQ